MSQHILLIVPCYNEQQRFDRKAFIDFLSQSSDYRILFVNDGSSDGTGRMLKAFVQENPGRVDWLDLPENVGKAEAVRRGFLKAFTSDVNFIGYMDADLAAPLTSFYQLKRAMDEAGHDMAIGARVKLLGRRIERNGLRHILGRAFATAASCVLDLPVYDTQCGAKLFRRTPLLENIFSFPFTSRWIFDVEIMARMIALRRMEGLSSLAEACVECPLEEWIDRKGSKVAFKDFVRSAFDLWKIFLFLQRCRKSPGYYTKLRNAD